MTKELFNFNYNISVDVISAVEDFYPGLNDNQVQTIAAEIVNNFDYSVVYNQIQDDIEYYAQEEDINLVDKNVPPIQSHLTAI
jgi:hypothetical protein